MKRFFLSGGAFMALAVGLYASQAPATPPPSDLTICRFKGVVHEYGIVRETVTRIANNIDKYAKPETLESAYARVNVMASGAPVFNDALLNEFPMLKARCTVRDKMATDFFPLCTRDMPSLALGKEIEASLESSNYANTGGAPCLRILKLER